MLRPPRYGSGGVCGTSRSAWRSSFGLIDADAFTREATNWTGVSTLVTQATSLTSVGAAIPDNNVTGITRSFSLSGSVPLEEVQVYLNITHTYRGDLEAFLTSPSGYTSRLMSSSSSDGTDNIDWTFTSNAFWGAQPAGTWSLKVHDVYAVDTGTWNSFQVTAFEGQLVPEPSTLALFALGLLAVVRRRRIKVGR